MGEGQAFGEGCLGALKVHICVEVWKCMVPNVIVISNCAS